MVAMGHVLGAYGVAGWIKVSAYTEAQEGLLDFPAWWLQRPGEPAWHRWACIDGRLQGDTVVAQLEGIGDRDAALALKGSIVGVPRSALPAAAEGEIYWADLVGLEVVNREGRVLGCVRAVTAHAAHPLLQVVAAAGGAERLIPYVPAVIDAVDLERGRIEVDWGEDF